MSCSSALLIPLEMALRWRGKGCAWAVVGEDQAPVVVGSDQGRPFAIALSGGLGERPEQVKELRRWAAAGASTGAASTIREALAIIERGTDRAR